MTNSSTHTINKVFLEVNTKDEKKAFYIRDHIDAFLQKELLPFLESYFDSVDDSLQTDTLRFERLEMNLSVSEELKFSEIKSSFQHTIKEKIDQSISQGKSGEADGLFITKEVNQERIFFHFLKTGNIPWWAQSKQIEIFENKEEFDSLIGSGSFIEKIIKRLFIEEERFRLIKQFTDFQLKSIVDQINKNAKLKVSAGINALHKIIEKGTGHVENIALSKRNLSWDILISTIIDDRNKTLKPKLVKLIQIILITNKDFLQTDTERTILQNLKGKTPVFILNDFENLILKIKADLSEKIVDGSMSDTNVKGEQIKPPSAIEPGLLSDEKGISKKKFSISADELTDTLEKDILSDKRNQKEELKTHFIENAGLVLLHHFIKPLFINCKLLNDDNQLINPELAAHLLHFVATNKESEYENKMLFEKYLCNIPVSETINRNIRIPTRFKKHVIKMQRAFLENWTPMKESSIDLLQNEFLTRPGKISIGDENSKLIIEKKTQDILLNKLPFGWSISMLKLEWMDQILFVDW